MPRRILVVEDSVDSAETMAELLRVWGHDVRIAHTGDEALRAAREYRPDVVLLDIGLPDMDGYEVAKTLRRESLVRDLLVALTGFSPEQAREHASRGTFDRHLTKPVAPDALAAVLGES